MTTHERVIELKADLSNWVKVSQFAKEQEQFTASQLKHLIWRRSEHPGLDSCYRQVGKTGYLNRPIFGLWMAGTLPEQQG